jgi:hypothetical protein
VIIKDTFSGGTNGDSIQGTVPESNLPASSFNTKSYFGAAVFNENVSIGNPAGSAEMGGSAAAFISIASAGTYVKPATLNISADLRLGTINNDSDSVRGIFIGFRGDATVPDEDPTVATGYSGLQFAPDGTVYLRKSGDTTIGLTSLGSYNAAALGELSATDFYRISYRIDSATGAYSNAVLTRQTGPKAGASVPLEQVETTTFTNANTNAAGFYADAHDPNVFGQVDNFVVAGPKPDAGH